MSKPLTIEIINNRIKNIGLECLDSTYQAAFMPMKFQCKEGHEFEIRWCDLYPKLQVRNPMCPMCKDALPNHLKVLNPITHTHKEIDEAFKTISPKEDVFELLKIPEQVPSELEDMQDILFEVNLPDPTPRMSGVYLLVLGEKVVYIGQSVNLFKRIPDHKEDKLFNSIYCISICKENLDYAERLLIDYFQPKYNKTHKNKENRDCFDLINLKKILYRVKDKRTQVRPQLIKHLVEAEVYDTIVNDVINQLEKKYKYHKTAIEDLEYLS